MMAGIKARIQFTGFQEWAKLLAPDLYMRKLRLHIPRATGQNAFFVAQAMKKFLQSGQGLTANAALTMSIKGGNKPLIDKQNLLNAIKNKKIDDFTFFAGVVDNEKAQKVMSIVHDGLTISVSEKMRSMFFALWLASEGRLSPDKLTGRAAELFARKSSGWLPLSQGTSVIVIPPRPFTEIVMRDKSLMRQVQENWHRALSFVFRDMKKEYFR